MCPRALPLLRKEWRDRCPAGQQGTVMVQGGAHLVRFTRTLGAKGSMNWYRMIMMGTNLTMCIKICSVLSLGRSTGKLHLNDLQDQDPVTLPSPSGRMERAQHTCSGRPKRNMVMTESIRTYRTTTWQQGCYARPSFRPTCLASGQARGNCPRASFV
jgi:hypothetical protein